MTARRLGALLLTLGVLTLLSCVACVLLAIWTGDGRWGDTAFLAFIVGIVTAAVGAGCLVEASL